VFFLQEIYNKLSPLEDLEVDSIKGISKWKSDMETDINFSDVFCNLWITNSMISNGHSLTFVINTIFAIFNSKEISKISSNHVFT
jgi:hypothetical protein